MTTSRLATHAPVRSILWLLLISAIVFAAGMGLRDPSPPDEPRFVLAAKHMVETGDWLLPHRGSELYGHKPPPFMWAQAASYQLVGNWRVAFLLPSLLAALGTLWLVWDAGRRLWNPRIAGYAALGLLVTLQFGLQAKRAQIDMSLVFLTTLSLWALLRATLLGPNKSMLVLGGFAAGLGTVTKGVGFLPLLLLIPYALTTRTWRGARVATSSSHVASLRWASVVIGLGSFIVGTAVWLLPLLVGVVGSSDPALQAYAAEILLRQTAQRYANPWHHYQPAWYYLQVMFTLWLPSALLLPWLVPAWWRRIKRGDARYIVLLGWSALVLLFFTLSPAKREVYIFPALPAFCLAAAPLLPGLLRRRGVQRVLFGYTLVLSLLLLITGLLGSFEIGRWPARLLADPQFLVADVASVWCWLAIIGAVGTLGALLWRTRHGGRGVLLFTLTLWFGYGMGLMPALNAASSSRGMMEAVGARIGNDAELGMIGWREQQLLMADRPSKDFGFERPIAEQWPDAAAWLSEAPQLRWLLVRADVLSSCVDEALVEDGGRANRRDWLLVPGHALRSGCHAHIDAAKAEGAEDDAGD